MVFKYSGMLLCKHGCMEGGMRRRAGMGRLVGVLENYEMKV